MTLTRSIVKWVGITMISFTLYSVYNNDPPSKQVCQFDRDKITSILAPTCETNVANLSGIWIPKSL